MPRSIPAIVRMLPALLLLGAAATAAMAQPPAGPTAAGEQRVALVVGNAAYSTAALPNCLNDAEDMAARLRAIGFQVTVLTNVDRRALREGIRALAERCNERTTALFYFSGHGVQVDGRNYVIPIGAELRRESDVEDEAVEVRWALKQLEDSRARTTILILDACRDNPLPPAVKSTAKGLLPVRVRRGSLVAFAASEGETASVNPSGRNSLYTQELLASLGVPGLKIEDVFKRTRVAVRTRSRDQQNPREDSALEEDVVLVPTPAGQPVAANPPAAAPARNPAPTARQEEANTPPASPTTGETRTNPKDGATLCRIPPGEFLMGSSPAELEALWRRMNWPREELDRARSEVPLRRVAISRGFWAYRAEVTNEMYRRFVRETGHPEPRYSRDGGFTWIPVWSDERLNGAQQPVVGVMRSDAEAYCRWAGARLPTEEEWEYAARGGDTGLGSRPRRIFPWGDGVPRTADRVGNLPDETARRRNPAWLIFPGYDDGFLFPAPVASFRANGFGLHDVAGNVAEWCSDGADGGAPAEKNALELGAMAPARGGSWLDSPAHMRLAARDYYPRDALGWFLGFRPVVSEP